VTASEDRFPPIASYGFLSDCHTGALIAPDGSVEWLCTPRFDSPSIFSALLDRRAGSFRFAPDGWQVPIMRAPEPGANTLTTWWMTPTGWVVVRDALAIGEWREDKEAHEHVRPPADHDAEGVLIRIASCFQGHVDMEMVCDPAFEYGAKRPEWTVAGSGRGVADASDGETTVRLTSDMRLGIGAGRVRARHTLEKGQSCFCALSWNDDLDGPRDLDQARALIDTTDEYWRRWLSGGEFPDHEWRAHLQRSALTLKGLTYAPTGATVAALTTSLPETPGGERNWDYRYTWIRDASFTLWSLHTLGFDWEAEDFIEFVADVCRAEGPELQIMYGVGGEKELTETTLDHLGGYGGAKPVRIGNAAFEQRQNDVYGVLLDAIYIHTKAHDELPESLWELIADQVEAAIEAWPKPDQGIWEARGEPKHYVSSKLMSWVALDRGARLALRRGERKLAARWGEIAGQIRADILDRGVSDRGVFRQHYETDALDASTLLVPLLRFLAPDDERVRATVMAIAHELTDHGLVLRYRPDETDDGLQGKEGTFTICSFWLVSALSEIGERSQARTLCERLLSFAGPLALYAEELDPHSGRHLGNFPQAFTHLALINAVSHVISDDLAPADRPERTAVFSEMRSRH
jgi:GH15 family glucan-1,4-alpha-glucosidase